MKLSVLIPCIPHRDHTITIRSLCDALNIPHADYFPTGTNEVEILTDFSPHPSGAKRQALMDKSKGEYICFLDDDDKVSPLYFTSILQGILSKPSVITFNLAFIKDGKHKETWKFGMHPNNRRQGLMAANHLCAWKRDIATKVAWCPHLGKSDDHLWFEALHAANLVKTCYYINETLYYYLFSNYTTSNQSAIANQAAMKYLQGGIRFFFWEEEIVIEVPAKHLADHVYVRNKCNEVLSLPLSNLREFHKYTL